MLLIEIYVIKAPVKSPSAFQFVAGNDDTQNRRCQTKEEKRQT